MKTIIFTGKGGVGKTYCSLAYSEQNKSSSLTEKSLGLLEEAHQWGLPLKNLVSITAQDLLKEFLMDVIRIEALAKFASKSKILQNLIQLAPNMDELLLLKKWRQISARTELVVDGPSTGNMTAMFDAIHTAQRMFDGGVLKKIADDLHGDFQQAHQTEIWIVSLPENSALEEMKEIKSFFEQKFPQITTKLILNRKHFKPQESYPLSRRLERLAVERPERELKRISQIPFDYWIYEGEKSFVAKA